MPPASANAAPGPGRRQSPRAEQRHGGGCPLRCRRTAPAPAARGNPAQHRPRPAPAARVQRGRPAATGGHPVRRAPVRRTHPRRRPRRRGTGGEPRRPGPAVAQRPATGLRPRATRRSAAAAGRQRAWTDGMLVAAGMRLDEFLAEVARYRPGRLAATRASAACGFPAAIRWTIASGSSPPCRRCYLWRYGASPATGSACTRANERKDISAHLSLFPHLA